MLNKLFKTRLFFQVIMASLVATLATVGIVAATTTIGSNISSTGTLAVTSTTATSTFSTGGLTVGTNQFVVQQTSGNVGIGTTNPLNTFQVSSGSFTNEPNVAFANFGAGIIFTTPKTANSFRTEYTANTTLAGGVTITGNTFRTNFLNNQSTALGALLGISVISDFTSGSGKVTTNTGLQVAARNNGSTGTISTSKAINILGGVGVTGTTTDAYGLYVNDITGTVNTPFGIYQAGSNDYNYFAGYVGIGTTTPTTQLQVTASATNATSTITVGKTGQNKGSCLELFDAAGTAVYAYVAPGAATFTLSASSCK